MNSIASLYVGIQLLKARAILFVEPLLVVISAAFAVIGLTELHTSTNIVASATIAMVLVAAVEVLNIYSAIAFRLARGWGKFLPFLGMIVCSAISIASGELFWQSLAEGQVFWVHGAFTAFAAACPLFLIFVEATKTSFENAIIEVGTTALPIGSPEATEPAVMQQTMNVQINFQEVIPVVREIVTQVIEERNLLVPSIVGDNETYIPTRTEGAAEPVVTPAISSNSTRGRADIRTKVAELIGQHGQSYVREHAQEIGQQLGCSYKTVIRHADKVCA